jgi:AraC-like DNA-binding protein
MAKGYTKDDALIYTTGQPLLHRLELWFDEMGMPDWFLVSKLPLRGRDGTIIGIMGFSQSYERHVDLLPPLGSVAKAVDLIRRQYPTNITMVKLGHAAGLSPRQLERRFKAIFGIGPWEFLIKTRVLAACKALEAGGDRSMAEIGLNCGFGDQSAFTHHFHHHVGITPGRFRIVRARR